MDIVVFGIVVALWVAFAFGIAISQASLHDIWGWFGDQALIVQVPLGIVFLPWVIGMWAWESSWALAWRLAAVAGLAWATVYMFFPWKAR